MATKKKAPKTMVERTRESIESTTEDVRKATRKGATKVALTAIDTQKRLFNSTIDVIGKGQDQAGDGIKTLAKKASFLPEETVQIVEVWNSATKKTRKDFKAAMNKSYDLASHFVEGDTKKKAAPAKRKPAKRKKAAPRARKATATA